MAWIKRQQFAGMNQHYRRYPLDYFLEAQQRVGFQNIELWLGAPHFWLDSSGYDNCSVVKEKIRQRGLKVVSVTSPSMAYQYQYASQEREHFEKSARYFSNGIKVAADLGAGIMTINSGWGYWNEDMHDAFERSKDMISRLSDVAAAEGIVLAMESLTPLESNIVFDIETAKALFDAVNHPALKIMVDTVATGSANETIRQWFEVFAEDLIHMHFIDGDRRTDGHYIWGDGQYCLEEELQQLADIHYTGYLVQEVVGDKYLRDPISADLENMSIISRAVRD